MDAVKAEQTTGGGVEPMTAARDALAAKHFPNQWAAIASAPGKSKARQKYRRDAERAERREVLRRDGHSCADCSCFNRKQPSSYQGTKHKTWCGFMSDFHGYVFVDASDICSDWTPTIVTAGVGFKCDRCKDTGWREPIGPCSDGSYVTSRPCTACDEHWQQEFKARHGYREDQRTVANATAPSPHSAEATTNETASEHQGA